MKKKENKETLKFLREYFKIPANKTIGWAIIKEVADYPCCKPGVYIEGSDLFLDIAEKRFYTNYSSPLIFRRAYPATRTAQKHTYRYTAKDNPQLSITRAKTYITDIYYPAIYSKELEKDKLL